MQVRFRYLEKSFDDDQLFFSLKNFLKKGKFLEDNYRYKFEKFISEKFKKNSIAVCSGTNALYLVLKLLNLKKNDEVLVPCLSWVSTFAVVKYVGATPVGIDIDLNMQMKIQDIKKKINKKTKAIIFVHFQGFVTDLTELRKFCDKKKIVLIEDCAQSFGGIVNKKMSGTFGHFSTFSFNPMKVINSTGQLGLIIYEHKRFKRILEIMSYVGTKNKEYCVIPELNHKPDNIQMLFVRNKITKIEKIINRRISIAHYYNNFIINSKMIIKPKFADDFSHIYYDYVLQVKYRNKLFSFLKKKGIECKIRHRYLICHHRPFKKKNNLKNFKTGLKISKSLISLPIDEKLTFKQINYVVKNLNSFYLKYEN